MDDFLTQWVRFHPGDFPVSHTLRDTSFANWVRFHSLPESKRYADDPHEASVILHRMTTLANEVLGNISEVFLVMAHPKPFPESECEPWTGEIVDLDVTDPEMARHFRLMEERWHDLVSDTINEFSLKLTWTFSSPDDECHYQIFSGLTQWQDDKNISLMRQIADDEIDRVFWMSANDGAIFAPYDGGADLILPDSSEAIRLKAKYSDWLPANSNGL